MEPTQKFELSITAEAEVVPGPEQTETAEEPETVSEDGEQ